MDKIEQLYTVSFEAHLEARAEKEKLQSENRHLHKRLLELREDYADQTSYEIDPVWRPIASKGSRFADWLFGWDEWLTVPEQDGGVGDG